MDLWPSSSQPVREVIRAWLNNCDIFVQVLGTEYGTLSGEGNLSYTELEFEVADKLAKPILSFLPKDGDYESHKRDKLEAAAKISSDAEAAEREQFERMDKFRARVSNPSRRLVRHYELGKKEQLYVDYLIAVHEQAMSMHEGGWVREPDVRSAIILRETIGSNEFFKRFVERLETFPILSQRAGDGRDEKKQIGEFFWDRYLSKFATWGVNRLYFESGSTLAYVGAEFSARLRKPWLRKYIDDTRKPNGKGEFRVYTNNILVYVDFALAEFDSDATRIERYPSGPADRYYGATFGELTSLIDHPAYRGNRALDPDAAELVTKASTELTTMLGKRGIVLMTASGLDSSDDPRVSGPHVGSYYNMLVKRALLLTKRPTVVFLHSAKIEQGDFHPNKCFCVCHKESTGSWKAVAKIQPIAIATSANSGEAAHNIVGRLAKHGFEFVESNWSDLQNLDQSPEANEPPPIITIVASNERFRSMFARGG